MATPLEELATLSQAATSRLSNGKYKARMRITVGSATCENAAGADAVYERFKELLQAHPDVALGRVGCTGKCDMEPVVVVFSGEDIPVKYVKMTPDRVKQVMESHVAGGKTCAEFSMRHMAGMGKARRVVSVCGGPNCKQGKNNAAFNAFRDSLQRHKLTDLVALVPSACPGFCKGGPQAYVHPDGITYQGVTPEVAETIVSRHFAKDQIVSEQVTEKPFVSNRFFPLFGDVSYFARQLRITLRNCGVIDPESLDEYFHVRGYEALAKVLQEMTPAQVVEAVKFSGLRGRGGGGYPTGVKWGNGASFESDIKYFICNADEGDPGAFMDRSTIEGDPHSVLEGMIIGGYAIGSSQGYIYIRAEYPLAIKRLEKAIADAREAGMLGKNILGSGHSFDIEIRLGAGAFVCGEETALIHSIEGRRGTPRPRPPYPSQSGLWRKPTVINNVETLANIPAVILDGPEWFAAIGTEKSKGTKVFALAGDVANTGLVEVAMGTTLREVVYDIGGGIKDGKKFKAVQTGGPAGGCLPESELDTPIDYDTLMQAGSIMGSGGMIVINEDACMVNVARFFLEFTQDESCGKCTPCREGTKRMLEILTRITEGQGVEGDVEKLLRLADTIKRTSLCGLGQAAPNPVISTIKHFRAEYDAHIREKRCPVKACKKLIAYTIIEDKCVGCGACKRNCPVKCISGSPKEVHLIDQSRCIKCGKCFEVCKFNAVAKG